MPALARVLAKKRKDFDSPAPQTCSPVCLRFHGGDMHRLVRTTEGKGGRSDKRTSSGAHLLTVYFGTPNMFITLYFRFV
jgi:hypothetical protein